MTRRRTTKKETVKDAVKVAHRSMFAIEFASGDFVHYDSQEEFESVVERGTK